MSNVASRAHSEHRYCSLSKAARGGPADATTDTVCMPRPIHQRTRRTQSPPQPTSYLKSGHPSRLCQNATARIYAPRHTSIARPSALRADTISSLCASLVTVQTRPCTVCGTPVVSSYVECGLCLAADATCQLQHALKLPPLEAV